MLSPDSGCQHCASACCWLSRLRWLSCTPLGKPLVPEVYMIRHTLAADSVCLIMYTSGTSGFPKGVQLSHRNLLSQQQALAQCWQPESGLRMLCYLPWHHSFGGLFERFFAVAFGGCLALDDGCGKDVDL